MYLCWPFLFPIFCLLPFTFTSVAARISHFLTAAMKKTPLCCCYFLSNNPIGHAIYRRNACVLEMQNFTRMKGGTMDVRMDYFVRTKIYWITKFSYPQYSAINVLFVRIPAEGDLRALRDILDADFPAWKEYIKAQVKINLNKELAKEVKANVKNAVLPIVKKPIKEVGHFSFLAM